jgi:hypothetical protein
MKKEEDEKFEPILFLNDTLAKFRDNMKYHNEVLRDKKEDLLKKGEFYTQTSI